MNEHDQQAVNESDIVDVVTTVQERGMGYLWQAVTEQIADLEAMRAHVMMARTLLGSGRTYTRLLKDWVSKGYSVCIEQSSGTNHRSQSLMSPSSLEMFET